MWSGIECTGLLADTHPFLWPSFHILFIRTKSLKLAHMQREGLVAWHFEGVSVKGVDILCVFPMPSLSAALALVPELPCSSPDSLDKIWLPHSTALCPLTHGKWPMWSCCRRGLPGDDFLLATEGQASSLPRVEYFRNKPRLKTWWLLT